MNPHDGYTVLKDGSLIISSRTQFCHFGTDGRMINRIGKKGEEQGAFQYVGGVTMVEGTYVVHDPMKRTYLFFDQKGSFLKEYGRRWRNVFFFDSFQVAVLSERFKTYGPDKKPLAVITWNSENELQRDNGKEFHFIRQEIWDYNQNFRYYMMKENGGLLYVLDEMSPEVCVYNPKLQLEKRFNLELSGYERPSDRLGKGITRKVFLDKVYAMSRITAFHMNETKIAIAYSVPNTKVPDEPIAYVQLTTKNGKALGKAQAIKGTFIGGYQNTYYTVHETDELEYILKITEF